MNLKFQPMPEDSTRKQVILDATRLMAKLTLRRFISSYPLTRLRRMNGRQATFGIEAAVLEHIDKEERKREGRPPKRIEAIMAYLKLRPKIESEDDRATVSANEIPTRKGTPFEKIEPAFEQVFLPKAISKDVRLRQD